MIVVEDLAHFTLIKTIRPGMKIIMAGDKFRVGKYLEKSTQRCIGVIDEDSDHPYHQPRLIRSLKPIEQNHDLKLYASKNFKLISIGPIEFEDWLLMLCRIASLDLREKPFELPNSHKELKKVINLKKQNVEVLLSRLIEIKSPGLIHLKSILNP